MKLRNILVIIVLGMAGVVFVFAFYPSPGAVTTSFFQMAKAPQRATATPTATTTLIVVGDIMLGRYVERLMDQYGPDYPFRDIAPLLASGDAAIGNLEGVIDRSHEQTPSGSMMFSFPLAAADVIAQNHFSILTLGNNHTYDFGREGYLDTASALEARSIVPVGNPYAVGAESWHTGMIGGRKMTFVSFNATFPHFAATSALALVSDLKNNYPDALLVVFMHWGVEYQLNQSPEQQNFAHDLIDNGTDLVIGSHPHVVEGIEVYRNKPIFYSLGNFIFDQYFSQDVQEELMLSIGVGDSGMSIGLMPIESIRSQPAPMPPQKAAEWLSALASRSTPSIKKDIEREVLLFAFSPKP